MKASSLSAPRRPVWKMKKTWLIAALVVLAGVGAGFYGGLPASLFPQQAATTGPDYHTATVRRGNISISASGSGTLTVSQTVDLSFSTKGILAEVDVKAGDVVKAGQALAQLGNTESLQAAVANDEYQLLQAQQAVTTIQQNANVALAQSLQAMITAQQNYNNLLTADQRTAYARCSDTQNTKLKTALDSATTKLLNISQRYYGSDAWINANNVYQQALANYNYCIAYTPDEKTNANASLQVAQVTLQQAQQTYKTLNDNKGIDPLALSVDQAKVNQAQTQLTQDQQNLKGAALVAPIDGTVTFLAAEAGSMVDTSKFITISDLSHPAVNVSVDETDLSKFTVGSTAQVVFDALPDQAFEGNVTQVNPQLTTSGQYQVATGVIQLGQDAAQALQKMPLGLSATVTIIQKQAKNVLLVPISAIRNLGTGQYTVFVVGKDGKLQLRFVQVGLQDTTQAEIISGLNEGDVISTGTAQTK